MAVLDDRVEEAFDHLREELRLFRLANDRFDRVLAGGKKRTMTHSDPRAPQLSVIARTVRGWFTRWRNFWIRKNNRNTARRMDE